jgi:glutamate dehydrogenase (NADP+)
MSLIQDNSQRLEEVSKILNLSEKEFQYLLKPQQISYKLLNLEGKEYPAWRIIYNQDLGPGKGGIRFHPDVSQEEVEALALWMTLKNSLANLPYGGAKGGIKVNPKELSSDELQALSREYVKAFVDVLGPDQDIAAPDVYTNQQTMAWMLDEYEKITKKHQPAMITGKPIELGGLAMRMDATAQGAYIISQQVIDKYLKDKEEIKVAIQGFGNAGSFLASKLYDKGYKIVAVSDSQAGVYDENGLNILELIEFKKNNNSLADYQNAQIINNQELLSLDKIDILALAALENQITEENANSIQAKYILELANGPVSFQADKILQDKQIVVIPDVLTNAGGVIVSYFEWAQNKVGQVLDENYLKELLEKKMLDSWQAMESEMNKQENKISWRQAAYLIAVKKVLQAATWRGKL